MKRYSPRKPAHHPRVPAFVPVATRSRKDGWTARRQAAFLAALAITGSVCEAARRVSMARETAYRLRRREGAESFAAAWDAIAGRFGEAPRKVTPEEYARRAIEGLLKPMIYRGKHVANQRKTDNSALLRYWAQLDRGQGSARCERERSQGFAQRSASAVGPANCADKPRGTPPDTPGRTRTGALSPACTAAARSGGTRR
ncbi:hypothetical protein [Novosphingobium sp. Gsoil 351]|uniref:hypothetical protein n=1 Tax=Novosphingobium sp. Gsoil 351 TaxID=2675225 RepID=UPI0018A8686B|nr:hypothetical protein [Novosphingobium sp. Gsoil 351]